MLQWIVLCCHCVTWYCHMNYFANCSCVICHVLFQLLYIEHKSKTLIRGLQIKKLWKRLPRVGFLILDTISKFCWTKNQIKKDPLNFQKVKNCISLGLKLKGYQKQTIEKWVFWFKITFKYLKEIIILTIPIKFSKNQI